MIESLTFVDPLLGGRWLALSDESHSLLKSEYGLRMLEMFQRQDIVQLSLLAVKEQRKGNGTRFLGDVCDWADRNSMTLTLTPDSCFGVKKSKLEKFYSKFGFVPTKGKSPYLWLSDEMIRFPVISV